jgi:hypothetical protein
MATAAFWAVMLGLIAWVLRRLGRMFGLGRRRKVGAALTSTSAPTAVAPKIASPVAPIAPVLPKPLLDRAYREAMAQPHMSGSIQASLPPVLPPSVTKLDVEAEYAVEDASVSIDPTDLIDLEPDEIDPDRDLEGTPFDGNEAWQRATFEQLKATLAADSKALSWRHLLNREEFPLFEKIVDRWARWRCLRVMAQVNMGEFIRTRKGLAQADDLYKAFGSKRVDLLVCDWLCRPLIAIEYHGSGHFQGTWVIRDAIKEEALKAVGIPLVVVQQSYAAKTVQGQLTEALKTVKRTPGKVREVYAMRPNRRDQAGSRS